MKNRKNTASSANMTLPSLARALDLPRLTKLYHAGVVKGTAKEIPGTFLAVRFEKPSPAASDFALSLVRVDGLGYPGDADTDDRLLQLSFRATSDGTFTAKKKAMHPDRDYANAQIKGAADSTPRALLAMA